MISCMCIWLHIKFQIVRNCMEGNYDKSDKLIAAIHMLCKYHTITFYHVNEIPEILFCQFVRMEYFQSLPFFRAFDWLWI